MSRDWLALSRDQVTWADVNSSSWEVFSSAGHQLHQIVLRSAAAQLLTFFVREIFRICRFVTVLAYGFNLVGLAAGLEN